VRVYSACGLWSGRGGVPTCAITWCRSSQGGRGAGHATGAAWSVHARAPSRAVLFSAYFCPVASGLIFCSLSLATCVLSRLVSGALTSLPPPTYGFTAVLIQLTSSVKPAYRIYSDISYLICQLANCACGAWAHSTLHGYGFTVRMAFVALDCAVRLYKKLHASAEVFREQWRPHRPVRRICSSGPKSSGAGLAAFNGTATVVLVLLDM
jgi:hypothetical protein